MDRHPVSVRLPKDVHDRLARQAKANNCSLHGEMLAIMKEAVKASPLRVVIRHCSKRSDGDFYAASIEGEDDDFADADNLAAIIKAVQDRVGPLGEVSTEFIIETISA